MTMGNKKQQSGGEEAGKRKKRGRVRMEEEEEEGFVPYHSLASSSSSPAPAHASNKRKTPPPNNNNNKKSEETGKVSLSPSPFLSLSSASSSSSSLLSLPPKIRHRHGPLSPSPPPSSQHNHALKLILKVNNPPRPSLPLYGGQRQQDGDDNDNDNDEDEDEEEEEEDEEEDDEDEEEDDEEEDETDLLNRQKYDNDRDQNHSHTQIYQASDLHSNPHPSPGTDLRRSDGIPRQLSRLKDVQQVLVSPSTTSSVAESKICNVEEDYSRITDEDASKPLKRRKLRDFAYPSGATSPQKLSSSQNPIETIQLPPSRQFRTPKPNTLADSDSSPKSPSKRSKSTERMEVSEEPLSGSRKSSGSTFPLSEEMAKRILDTLQLKDLYNAFSEPVDPKEVPDYYNVIKNPMDFGTMRKKLTRGSYKSLDDFQKDILLICTNAMHFNAKDTVYYKQGRAIQDTASKISTALQNQGLEKLEEVLASLSGKPAPATLTPAIRPKRKYTKRSHIWKARLERRYGIDNSGEARVGSASLQQQLKDRNRRSNNGCSVLGFLSADHHFSFDDANVDQYDEAVAAGRMNYRDKKVFVDDRRSSYRRQSLPPAQSGTFLATLGCDVPQLTPTGYLMEYAYARSLTRYTADLGPVAWKIAAEKIGKALPPGMPFGPGWVGEQEALFLLAHMSSNKEQHQQHQQPQQPQATTKAPIAATKESKEIKTEWQQQPIPSSTKALSHSSAPKIPNPVTTSGKPELAMGILHPRTASEPVTMPSQQASSNHQALMKGGEAMRLTLGSVAHFAPEMSQSRLLEIVSQKNGLLGWPPLSPPTGNGKLTEIESGISLRGRMPVTDLNSSSDTMAFSTTTTATTTTAAAAAAATTASTSPNRLIICKQSPDAAVNGQSFLPIAPTGLDQRQRELPSRLSHRETLNLTSLQAGLEHRQREVSELSHRDALASTSLQQTGFEHRQREPPEFSHRNALALTSLQQTGLEHRQREQPELSHRDALTLTSLQQTGLERRQREPPELSHRDVPTSTSLQQTGLEHRQREPPELSHHDALTLASLQQTGLEHRQRDASTSSPLHTSMEHTKREQTELSHCDVSTLTPLQKEVIRFQSRSEMQPGRLSSFAFPKMQKQSPEMPPQPEKAQAQVVNHPGSLVSLEQHQEIVQRGVDWKSRLTSQLLNSRDLAISNQQNLSKTSFLLQKQQQQQQQQQQQLGNNLEVPPKGPPSWWLTHPPLHSHSGSMAHESTNVNFLNHPSQTSQLFKSNQRSAIHSWKATATSPPDSNSSLSSASKSSSVEQQHLADPQHPDLALQL